MPMQTTSRRNAAIYQAWKDGTSMRSLATQYGVSTNRISQIIHDVEYKLVHNLSRLWHRAYTARIIDPDFDTLS